jgi:hypothetical protein
MTLKLLSILAAWPLIMLGIFAYHRYVWNGGICRKNGLPWKDQGCSDSTGSALYEAGDEHHWFDFLPNGKVCDVHSAAPSGNTAFTTPPHA